MTPKNTLQSTIPHTPKEQHKENTVMTIRFKLYTTTMELSIANSLLLNCQACPKMHQIHNSNSTINETHTTTHVSWDTPNLNNNIILHIPYKSKFSLYHLIRTTIVFDSSYHHSYSSFHVQNITVVINLSSFIEHHPTNNSTFPPFL